MPRLPLLSFGLALSCSSSTPSPSPSPSSCSCSFPAPLWASFQSPLGVLFGLPACLCFIDTFDLFQCMHDSFIMYEEEDVCAGCVLVSLASAHWLIHRPGTGTGTGTGPRPPRAPVICWQMSYNNVTLSVHHNKIIRPSAICRFHLQGAEHPLVSWSLQLPGLEENTNIYFYLDLRNEK